MAGIHDQTPTVTRTIDAAPARVWAVLADGWLYPGWVVGASRMRAVDDEWPDKGSQLHHSVGVWPAGAAEVLVELEAAGERTVVHIREDALTGPGVLMPEALRQMMIVPRNREGLRRLAFLAEGRQI